MSKRVFYFFTMACLFLVSIHGVYSLGTGGIDLYYTISNTDLFNDTTGNGYDGVNNGGATGGAGIIDESVACSPTDYIDSNWDATADATIPYSLSFWFKTSTDYTGQRISMTGSLDEQGPYDPYIRVGFDDVVAGGDPNKIVVAIRGDGGSGIEYRQSNGTVNDGNWHHVVVVVESGPNATLYLDGDIQNTDYFATSPATGNVDPGDDFPLCAYQEKGAYYEHFTGSMDEFSIWDIALTSNNVTELYNNGTGLQYPFIVSSVNLPIWVPPTPGDGVANNTQVTFNASCDVGANRYMWFDTVNPPVNEVLSNSSSGEYTTNVSIEGTYYYVAACYNVTSGLFSVNTTLRTWIYDIQSPAILLNAENEFNDNNYSLRNQFDDGLNISLNFTDDRDLYAWNVTITAQNGTIFYTDGNQSISGISWLLERNVDVSSLIAGWYDFAVWVSDSHTANVIPDYQVTKKKSSIAFKPGNDNNIRVETRETSVIDAVKLVDRYSFTVAFTDGATKERVFDVKTDKCPLDYRPNSGYKAHFVSFCGFGEEANWIDFEGAASSPIVEKIDDYHYTVSFSSVPPVLTFESVGGLNIYNRNFSWYRGKYEHDSDRATAGDPFDIWLNMTTDSSFTVDTSFLWNGTAYNLTNTNGSGWAYWSVTLPNESVGDYWYFFNVTVTQVDGNVSAFTINQTQSVEDWYMDDCSAATNVSIRWDLFDENNPANPLNGTAQLLMEYWPTNKSNSKILNASYALNSTFLVCLSPADLTFYADIYLQNSVQGAFTHRFYVQNGTFSVNVTEYDIFNFLNQTDISDMRITTRNQSDYSYMENVLVYLQRQYIGEGVWRTVQMDKSGDYGLVFFNIIEENTDYRLLYYDAYNNLLHQTTSMKFACNTGICDLTQLLTDYEETTTSDQVTASVSYNNATSVISVVWNGPPTETHTVAFTATKETATGPLTLCSSSQTGASGSFNCNATGANGQVFVSAVVDGSTSAAAEWVDTRTQTLGDQMSVAEASLWSFGIAGTITMIGVFSPVGAIIGLVIGLIVVFFLGILGPLSITALILAVVVGVAISLKVRT